MNHKSIMYNWLARTKAVEESHFESCARFRSKHYFWGAVMVGSGAFSAAITGIAEANEEGKTMFIDNEYMLFLRILLAMAVPAIAAIVSFKEYNVRSERHHHAAAQYAALKRSISLAIAEYENSQDDKEAYKFLSAVCEKWNALTESSPALYGINWKKKIHSTEEKIEVALLHNQSYQTNNTTKQSNAA